MLQPHWTVTTFFSGQHGCYMYRANVFTARGASTSTFRTHSEAVSFAMLTLGKG